MANHARTAGPGIIETGNCQYLDVLKPSAAAIDFCVIATALSRMHRFGGRTVGHAWPVAGHALSVAAYVRKRTDDPRVILAALH